ncbi:tetratricopeptide repeat protein [Sphingomonas flavalba]|uniref:tetratricopeptide repeat protein n=1 Tax=Sphingomonas flavalba TaxID=2559804 RepID=UPI00109DA687|nr:cytochrome C biogenesis protein [Sphingomonas flavalba]
MTGWLIALALTLAVGLALWRFGHMPRVAREPVLAALLLGLGGYALQGSPGLPGKPAKPRAAQPKVDEATLAKRQELGSRFGSDVAWLIASEGMMRAGLTEAGVGYVKRGLRDYPNSPDLWTGLGNALVVHAGGQASPASVYAYHRAMAIAPDSPAAPFFLGLSLAQSGRLEEARATWAAMLARAPADAPWREDIALRLRAVDMLLKAR